MVQEVCFIAFDAGPADHFATFAEELQKKGYQVSIYGSGAALDRFAARNIKATKFENTEAGINDVALKVQSQQTIIHDVGNVGDVTLAQALKRANAWAYYDNSLRYAASNYNLVADGVLRLSKKVLTASALLEAGDIYKKPQEPIPLKDKVRVGIGYYNLERAKEIAAARAHAKAAFKEKILRENNIKTPIDKIIMYAGGNNDDYRKSAFPWSLNLLDAAAWDIDLSKVLVIYQQHPAAKNEKFEDPFLNQQIQNVNSPQLIVSNSTTDDVLKAADAVFYHQTSMWPLFGGIPTVRVAHDEAPDDICLQQGWCENITKDLKPVLRQIIDGTLPAIPAEQIPEPLGFKHDWCERLIQAIHHKPKPIQPNRILPIMAGSILLALIVGVSAMRNFIQK